MTSPFTLASAQRLLPEARRRIAEAAAVVGELRVLIRRRDAPDASSQTAAEAADKEQQLETQLRWFLDQGIEVKGIEPALLDFPSVAVKDGEPCDVLLCWRDDEDTIAFYHHPQLGYPGREPVAMLDEV